MTIEIQVDGTKIGTMGPQFEQKNIGDPATVALTYTGDESGKLFVSNLVNLTKPTELLLQNQGDIVGTDITLASPLFSNALIQAYLTAIRA